MQETWVLSLGREDPREKEMATHSSIQHSSLGNPMVRGTWRATIHRVARVGHNWATEHAHTHLLRNCSCTLSAQPRKNTSEWMNGVYLWTTGSHTTDPKLTPGQRNNNYNKPFSPQWFFQCSWQALLLQAIFWLIQPQEGAKCPILFL